MPYDVFSPVVESVSLSGSVSRPVGQVLAPDLLALTTDSRGHVVEGQPSVVLALPVGREVLIAACVLAQTEQDPLVVAGMSDGELRDWVLLSVLEDPLRASAATGMPLDLARLVAEYPVGWLEVLSARIDAVFGFGPAVAVSGGGLSSAA